jgi:hypothetical protein
MAIRLGVDPASRPSPPASKSFGSHTPSLLKEGDRVLARTNWVQRDAEKRSPQLAEKRTPTAEPERHRYAPEGETAGWPGIAEASISVREQGAQFTLCEEFWIALGA